MSGRYDMKEWQVPHRKRSLKGPSIKDISRRRQRRVANRNLRDWLRMTPKGGEA